MGYFGLLSLVIIGSAIIIITFYLVSALVLVYFGKDILLLELGITLYSVGYFNHFFLVFRFIVVIIKVEIVIKLFG